MEDICTLELAKARQIVVTFDPETYGAIEALAFEAGATPAEVIASITIEIIPSYRLEDGFMRLVREHKLNYIDGGE